MVYTLTLFYTLLHYLLIYGAFAYLHQVAKTRHIFYIMQGDGQLFPWFLIRYVSFIVSIPWLAMSVAITATLGLLVASYLLAHFIP